jgi:hypothetical protein
MLGSVSVPPVIRLALRLTLNGGREAAIRLVVTAGAVALGVGMLLVVLAGINALNAQNARTAWLSTGSPGGGPPSPARPAARAARAATPAWWLFSADNFGQLTIDRVDVAATGPGAPVPPGLPHLPGPGQFYASPALTQLLRSTPAGELGDRFPGHQIGTIGPAALPAPNSLIIVIGYRATQLSHAPGAKQVTSIATTPGGNGVAGYDPTTLVAILAVAALALLFPVLIFIATATRLAAARREQRFAAMRLVGATPRQVSVLSAVEACIAALGGAAIGLLLFILLRPVLQGVSFTGEPFARGDFSLDLADILLVVIGVPAAAAVAARVALRRVRISPLGVTRRVTPPAPRAYRLIPLLAGIAELGYFARIGHPRSSGGQVEAYTLGFFLVMAGLVIAGPWLTMTGSQIMAGRTSRPAALIAGRRLADNPKAAFRSIGGLILALFVTSVSAGITTTIIADHGAPADGVAASGTLADQFITGETASGHALTAVASVPATALTGLSSIPGVRGVTVIHTDPQAATAPAQNEDDMPGLVSCAQLARTPAAGRCAAGATVAAITLDLSGAETSSSQTTTVWPAAAISSQLLQRTPVLMVVLGTDGTTAAIERARTALEADFPYLGPPAILTGSASESAYAELQHLTYVVILVSLVVAGCSLAVSVAAGLTDRKRPFSLLRLAGAPLGVLRSVVVLESAVPLVVVAVISAGAGFLASALFLRSELGESLQPPGGGYYLIVLGGLLASLAVIACTFPLLKRITGPETARNE